jgi:hypothetical protein
MSDPVLDRAQVLLIRALLFLILSLALGGVFWYAVMMELYGVEWGHFVSLSASAFFLNVDEGNITHLVIFWSSFVLSTSLIGNVYLYIGASLKKQSQVHLRGAYMIDERGDR